MNSTKPRPSLLLFAFGLSVIVATLRAAWTGLWHPEDFGWIAFAFCLSFGITLVGGWSFFALPVEWHTMLTDVQYQATEKAKLVHQAETLGAAPVAGNGAGAVVDNPSKAHIAAWRAWWLAVFVYAAEHGGVVSWKDKDGNGLLKLVKRHEHWLNYFVTPFNGPQYRWLEPCYQGGKTKLREGVTIWFIIGELTRGNVPPTPLDLPPAFKSGEFETVETSEFTDETLVKEL